MKTLKAQNIDTKKINWISFQRPDWIIIWFQDGSSVIKTLDRFTNRQIKILEKFERS